MPLARYRLAEKQRAGFTPGWVASSESLLVAVSCYCVNIRGPKVCADWSRSLGWLFLACCGALGGIPGELLNEMCWLCL